MGSSGRGDGRKVEKRRRQREEGIVRKGEEVLGKGMIEEKREKVGHGQPTSLFHLVKLQLTTLDERRPKVIKVTKVMIFSIHVMSIQ